MMDDEDDRPRPHACPRCFQTVKPVWRWRGGTVVAIGFQCPTVLCGYRQMRPAWTQVAQA